MILFLDFDGVLHGLGQQVFEHLPRFEAILREFPHIEVVISSSWREKFSLEEMREFFSEDVQPRLVGTTPVITAKWPPYPRHVRHQEIQEFIVSRGFETRPWLALDDDMTLFPADCPSLILCEPVTGFDDEMADVLRARLNDSMGLDRRVMAYQVAGEVSVLLHTGEMLIDSDPEALAAMLFERGFRSCDVHNGQERNRAQGAGLIVSLKRTLRQLAEVSE